MNCNLIPKFHYSFRTIDLFFALYATKRRKERVNRFFNYKKIYFLNSARTALKTFLFSISDNKCLRVGVQVYTCETVFKAIRIAGCEPVFIDIDNSFNLDYDDLKSKIEKIDVLIVTHTFGFPFDIDKIKNIKRDLIIIEDCAHAYLTLYKEKPCGTLGDVGIFSFGYGKFPSIGSGGFIVINNSEFILKYDGFFKLLSKPSLMDNFIHLCKNYFYSLSFIPAIYGILTYPILKKMDRKLDFIGKSSFTEKQSFFVDVNVFYNNFIRYQNIARMKAIKAIEVINELKLNLPQNPNLNYYIIPIMNINRDEIAKKMLELGFECGKHFHESIQIANLYGYQNGTCPRAEETVKKILTIPVHSFMKKRLLKKMIYEIIRLI